MLEQHIEADQAKIVSSELLKKASTELLYDSLDKIYRDYIGAPGIPHNGFLDLHAGPSPTLRTDLERNGLRL